MRRPWLILPILLLAACAANRPVEQTESGDSGPTVYGRVSVSVDHVSTK